MVTQKNPGQKRSSVTCECRSTIFLPDSSRIESRTTLLCPLCPRSWCNSEHRAVETVQVAVAEFEEAAIGLLLGFLGRRAEPNGHFDLLVPSDAERFDQLQRG